MAARHHALASALAGLAPWAAAPHDVDAAVRFALHHCGARSGPTPYTGAAGLALALARAGQLGARPDWTAAGQQLSAQALATVDGQPGGRWVEESLLDGVAGVVLVGAQLAERGSAAQQRLLARYAAICETAASAGSAASDEFLYGRAGCLFGGLLLRRSLGAAALPEQPLRALGQRMLASGRQLAAQLPVFGASGAPLGYLWPPGRGAEPYLGAAHGLIGIAYVLLLLHQHVPQSLGQQDVQDVRASVDYVLRLECDAAGMPPGSGGHYPTLMRLAGVETGREHAALVHWCHGAPGAVYLLCTAHKVLGGEAYLQAAVRAGELVWQRGLLVKGPGLCHGVSGNGFALLRLWRATQDAKWLERARLYAAFMLSPAGRADWATPDHPGSLFEGLGGGVALLAELEALLGGAAGGAGGGGAPAGPAAPAATAGGFPLFEL